MANYDKRVPPTSVRLPYTYSNPPAGQCGNSDYPCAPYSQAGTDVDVEVVFYKLDTVDVPHGHLQIKCWMRMWWQDTRLAWNESDPQWAGISSIPMLVRRPLSIRRAWVKQSPHPAPRHPATSRSSPT